MPYSYIKDIDFATMAKFSEHDVGLPGVDIAIKPVRSYVYGALASHLLGYVGAPDDINRDEARKYTFYQGDVEGKSNVEKTMDEYLRGQPGIRVMRRNAKGAIDGVLREEAPKQGADVYLTIDARIQAIADEALRAVARGAAVVVDPNNGNILAMASVPSFDPNTFIPSIKAKDWNQLRNDPAHPLVNRALSGLPPGSTFKIVTAFAGLRKHMGAAKFNCSGGVTYGDHYFHCWIGFKGGGHGTIGLADALKVSCDAYFLPIRERGGHRFDRRHRRAPWARAGIGHSPHGRTSGRAARPGLDGDSQPAREMVLGLHRERLHRPGIRSCLAAADGDGLCDGRERRHLLLSAHRREGPESGWNARAR